MQKVDITELRRLHEAATKGDWEVTRFMNIVTTPAPEDGGDIITESPNRYVLTSFEKWQANAEFIVAAHTALPALLDELEAAREALSQIYWKSIELGEDRGDSTINHIAADALKGDTSPLHARDRRQKLIGAAEWLEANNERLDTMNRSDVEEVAAQLRREAGK